MPTKNMRYYPIHISWLDVVQNLHWQGGERGKHALFLIACIISEWFGLLECMLVWKHFDVLWYLDIVGTLGLIGDDSISPCTMESLFHSLIRFVIQRQSCGALHTPLPRKQTPALHQSRVRRVRVPCTPTANVMAASPSASL